MPYYDEAIYIIYNLEPWSRWTPITPDDKQRQKLIRKRRGGILTRLFA